MREITNMKPIGEMTKREFLALPQREWNEDIGDFDSLVIIPGNSNPLHDSGFRFMDFVAVNEGNPICRLSGCSDVLNIDRRRELSLNHSWAIDCLPKSGLLHLFCHRKIFCGEALSSFEIFAKEKP